MSQIWMGQIAHISIRANDDDSYICVTWLMYLWVTWLNYMHDMTHVFMQSSSHISIRENIAHISFQQSYHTFFYGIVRATSLNKSCPNYEEVMSHVWMSQVWTFWDKRDFLMSHELHTQYLLLSHKQHPLSLLMVHEMQCLTQNNSLLACLLSQSFRL